MVRKSRYREYLNAVMIEQITITGSPADLAVFLNSIAENVQIRLSIDTENTPDPEGCDADGGKEADG